MARFLADRFDADFSLNVIKASEIRDANGRLLAKIDGKGDETSLQADALKTDYAYDGQGRLASLLRSDLTYEKYLWEADESAPAYTLKTIRSPWPDVSFADVTENTGRTTIEQHVRGGLAERITTIEKLSGTVLSQVVTTSTTGIDDSASAFPNQPVTTVSVRRQAPGAPESLSVTRTYLSGGDPRLAGKPLEIQRTRPV